MLSGIVKLLGIIIILMGVFGELFSWNEKMRRRIEQLETYHAFLNHSIYRLETEKIRMQDLLAQSEMGLEDEKPSKMFLSDVLNEVRTQMARNHYPSGIELWKQVWSAHRVEWNLDEQMWNLIIDSGKGFYGSNLKENLEYLRTIQGRWKEGIQEEKNRWKEKQKVFTPVGILGGIMIVIILL